MRFDICIFNAENPVSARKLADQQPRKTVPWTRKEKIAIMKHFKKHLYYGRLASVPEARRCQMLEQPVLNGRTIQNIKDFVRNAGISLRRKRASTSTEPSTQTANPRKPSIVPSPATDIIKPIFILSQTANATASTTLPPQASISVMANVVHPQPKKIIYFNVQAHQSANQITASLQLPSQAAHPSIIPVSSVVLPPTANQNIFSADNLTTPQVVGLTNSSILIPQMANHTGSTVLLPQVAPLISACILVPQAANPLTYNLLTQPAAEPAHSTVTSSNSNAKMCKYTIT